MEWIFDVLYLLYLMIFYFFFVNGEFGLLEMYIIWMICNGIYIDIVIYV